MKKSVIAIALSLASIIIFISGCEVHMSRQDRNNYEEMWSISFEKEESQEFSKTIEEEDFKITFFNVQEDGDYFWKIVTSVDNFSNRNLFISIWDLSINGYRMHSTRSTLNIQHGESEVHFSIGLFINELALFEITEIEQIEQLSFAIFVSDADDTSENAFEYLTDEYHINLHGNNPHTYELPERVHFEGERLLEENSDFSVWLLGVDKDAFIGDRDSLQFYIENHSEEALYFRVVDAEVDGLPCSSFGVAAYNPGDRGVLCTSLEGESDMEVDLESARQIMFYISVRNSASEDVFKQRYYYSIS